MTSADASGSSVPTPLLQVTDLCVEFVSGPNPFRAVDGVSLSLGQGETLAVVGESGSGKTVTAKTIVRLLDPQECRITGGTIMLSLSDGQEIDLATATEKQLQRLRGAEMSMIFQDPMTSLNPVFTIGDQVTESIRLHTTTSKRTAATIAAELLEQLGISDAAARMREYPHQLSGGMRQRVMIAIALASDPQLLIADEPTTALDVTVQAQIMELLREQQARRGMGMIFITHDLGVVADSADLVAVMYGGQVVEQGRTADVLSAPRHPYTRALIQCIPRGRGSTLVPIPGTPPPDPAAIVGCRFQARCTMATDDCAAEPIPLRRLSADHLSRCLYAEEVTPVAHGFTAAS